MRGPPHWAIPTACLVESAMSSSDIAFVYSPDLDFSLPDFADLGRGDKPGTGNVHAFDGARASRALGHFQRAFPERSFRQVAPVAATDADLALGLCSKYLAALADPTTAPALIAEILEVPAAAGASLETLDQVLLTPMRLATGGTLDAVRFVLEPGRDSPIAINLGGGYHHGHYDRGQGFCVYNDIAIAAALAEREYGVQRVLSVDVDAHQGNGTAALFGGRADRAHLDLYNEDIWPGDDAARAATRWPVGLPSGTTGEPYLAALEASLDRALDEFEPELILYNAGTDSLDEDALGNLCLTLADIRARDALVLGRAVGRRVPLVAVPSGGYSDSSHIALSGLLEVASRPRTLS